MNTRCLLLLALSTAACGSQVIAYTPPVDTDASADAAPPGDASDVVDGQSTDAVLPPPLLDVPRPDAAPPPPPTDLMRLCVSFCEQGNRACMATQQCGPQCEMLLSAPQVAACSAEIGAYLSCSASRNAFTCSRGNFNIDRSRCPSEYDAFERCADVAPPPPDDAGPPPPFDGGPPPPVDAGTSLQDACRRACDRAVRDCGRATSNCYDGCVASPATLGPRCGTLIEPMANCVANNGWTCTAGDPQPARACQPILDAINRCVMTMPPTADAGVPPPPVDAGPVPVYPGCAAACAAADRACGSATADCVTGCSTAPTRLPASCLAPFDRFLACLGASGFVCTAGRPEPSPRCAMASSEYAMCAMSGGGGGGVVDAGVRPDA